MTASITPSLPSLADLLGENLPRTLADCRHHTGVPLLVERVIGGNVAHVFSVRGPVGRVIIKIRRENYAGIPSLRADPALIGDERKLLDLYHSAAPGVFPRVLAFHDDTHTMVLSDVFPDGRTYHQHLIKRSATVREMVRLGRTLRRVHQATRDEPPLEQQKPDPRFPTYQRDFALRSPRHPAVDAACTEMASRPEHQLVLGDLAPKNISVTDTRIGLCDLDNTHHGWPLYDLGYFAGHLLIHHLTQPHELPSLVTSLLMGYQGERPLTRPDAVLTAAVAAGVALYRLSDGIVPYSLGQPTELADRYRARTHTLLDHGPFTFQDLVRAAQPGTVLV
ncbi:phosphotransferase [Streptomyces sp. ME02-6987-2C]|uniref:phosphotransferase n=1 Tax=unclassified Streptomyces TaxID=2593676 RepID=UPI00087D6382|nr:MULTISPECIES: phosphotransferase [unclassified Streptomyces]MDX3366439.1 phosphotransferase [Streptomyces sp. ME02-6987-2C]MDX3423738.1 phosphotransferase [Streptomyces sp. ME02-6985-2c]REH20636.1 phosphotransferase family enzyme [Streptomyces sp. 2221.1]SDT30897.1 Phosphotransferase enzyme family protein [Streptomyces sp. 2114.2]